MRNTHVFLLAFVAVTGLAAGAAAVRAEEPAPAAAPDFGARVKELADPDLEVRSRAYRELKEAGAGAAEALRSGAASEDAQVRWSSQRLLRLLDDKTRLGGYPGRAAAPGAGAPKEGEEEQEAKDAVRRGFRFELPEIPAGVQEEMKVRMEELQRHVEALRERMQREFSRERLDALRESASRLTMPRGLLWDGRSTYRVRASDTDRRRTLDVAEGSVRVTLSKKGEDGEWKEEAFEAPSLEALREQHPDVFAQVEDLVPAERPGGGFEWNGLVAPRQEGRAGRRGADPSVPAPPEAPSPPLPPFDVAPARRPLLGITLSDVPEVLRAQLRLPEGEGVVVEEVLDESLARRAGLRRHDVLLAVNGIPVSDADDIRGAVGAVGEGAEVVLRVVREGKAQDLRAPR